MAREVHAFDIFVSPNTFPGAPKLAKLAIPPRVVTEVEIVVPPGPRGQVGFTLGAAGRQIIPYEPGNWIVADNEVIHWPLEEQITSGAWELRLYNIGQYQHTLEVRFLCDLPAEAGSPAVPLPLAAGPALAPDQPPQLTGSDTPLAFVGFGG